VSDSILIGLMSGTSADGVSAAAVRIDARGPRVELLRFITIEYTSAERDRLLRAAEGAPPEEYARLAFDLGAKLADAALAVMRAAQLDANDIRAIASHGHTVWHAPPHATWQIGESAVIAERTGIDTLADFRVRDVAAGGQGAPLVAIADQLLFSHASRPRALQNLGGIANVSVVLPRHATGGFAFDTGPGCAVIDGVVRTLVPALPYDVDGVLAARGTPIAAALEESLADPYFEVSPPKSTGRERFSRDYIARFVARCRAVDPRASSEDIVATAVALTARSIGIAYERFVRPDVDDVLLSGGGVKNPSLLRAIRDVLAPRAVRLFSEEFFDDAAKEAVAFAFLGWLHLEHRAGNAPESTGAAGPRILGKLTPA
jgi:anhydro-N-acetylmuramic acid kinase